MTVARDQVGVSPGLDFRTVVSQTIDLKQKNLYSPLTQISVCKIVKSGALAVWGWGGWGA